MNIERDDATHTYTIDGDPVPGVSAILQGVGYVDPRHFDDESRQRGKDAHLACELHDKGRPLLGLALPKFDRIRGYVEAWKKFRKDTGFKPTKIEQIIGHPTLRYAGQLDRVGVLVGFSTLADIKTGQPAWWHPIQTAAYAGAEDPFIPRMGVYLKDNGDYRIESHDDWQDWDRFVWALNVWHEKEKHGLNRIDD